MTQPGTKPIPTATVDASAEDVRLYKRTAKLTLFRDGASYNLDNPTGIEITNLRFKFEVQRSLTSTPNSADVWIHNLSPRNRAELEGKNISVQVEAGYDGVNRLLCVGNVHFAMSEIQKTDWVTLLQLNDLGRAFTYGRVNRSYGAGTTLRKVVTDVAASMGLGLPQNLQKDTSLDQRLPAGIATYGQARLELTRILAEFGYHWSVQNGRLLVLRDEEPVDGEAIPIDQPHGMVGTPQFGAPPKSGKNPHITLKMLLYPEVAPGALVEVSSKALAGGKGRFKVEKVKHLGDTHAASGWLTEAEVLPL